MKYKILKLNISGVKLSKTQAAKMLGISVPTLHQYLKISGNTKKRFTIKEVEEIFKTNIILERNEDE